MLNGNIQIVTNITALGHYLQHIQWKLRWISIMQTQPLQPFHIGKMLHQVGQLAIAINIQTIAGRILGNQHHFFHAILHQPLNFLFDDLYGPRNVLTTHQRDGTERTRSITTLRNLGIGIMLRRSLQTLPNQLMLIVGANRPQQMRHIQGTKPCVHFWNFRLEFIFVTMRQTTGNV